MRLFDTHVHLSDKAFDDGRDEVIENMKSAGVELCIDVACDLRNVELTHKLTKTYTGIYAAYGMHPHYVCDMDNSLLDELKSYMQLEKCVALGEIGLDYHYDFSPRDAQKEWFAVQLELAQSIGKPVILHIREAFGDCMDILYAHREKLCGVMHCFSGSYEIAKRCLDMGLYIAFGGSLTFNNAHNLREVASRLPLDRLLIETDCPYMTPVPFRGKRNEPANVALVAEKLGELFGKNAEEVAEITFENAVKLFNISMKE